EGRPEGSSPLTPGSARRRPHRQRQEGRTAMEAKAKARFVRVTPQKARRVVDLIRGKQAGEAVAVLKFAPQAAGETVLKVVESAIANAREAAKRATAAFGAKHLIGAEC